MTSSIAAVSDSTEGKRSRNRCLPWAPWGAGFGRCLLKGCCGMASGCCAAGRCWDADSDHDFGHSWGAFSCETYSGFKFVGAVVGAPIWLWGNYFEVWPQVVNAKWLMVCKPLCQSHDPSRARLLKKLYQEWSSQCALQAPQKCLDMWAPRNSDDLITLQQKEHVTVGHLDPNRVLCSVIWTDHNFVLRQEEVLALRACKSLVSSAMVTRRGLHVHDNVDLSQPDVRGVNVAKACFTTATVFGVHLCSKWRGQQLRWPEHVGYVGQL